mgnify:CR=1 FL=1
MSKCTLCLKIFPSDSQLKRHKNNKKSCNVGKEEHKCELCNIIFPCLSKLEKHKKSNKHINIEKQYITDNSIHIENLNLNITNNITVINGFSETNIDILQIIDIQNLLIYEDEIYKFIKDFEIYPDEIYGDSVFIIHIFKFFIKIFAKLNFNLAHSENHNCIIYQFIKHNSKYIEYQILEIDNTKFNYNTKCIDYKLFIEQFINLMSRVNNKFDNHTFNYIYTYIIKYKKMLFSSDNNKIQIENELIIQYNKFQESKNDIETEEQIFQRDLIMARANAFKSVIRAL